MNVIALTFVPVLILSSEVAFAETFECDKAKDQRNDYLAYWDSQKAYENRDIHLDAAKFLREKTNFNGLYNRYMSSDYILNQAYFAKGIETLTN
ncbi:MAG: hypothetical protein GY816_23140, partial [Cytophagales bacterium]|nr:hypothetical protein [Cytophagales bacterium]